MPNWVNVKLSAHEDVINAITNDKGDVDFELIMPIPPDLKDYWTGSTVSLQEQAKDIVENKWEYGNGQHQIPMTEKDKERFSELFGAGSWYDWCVNNWGTKWNAQTTFSKAEEVGFETPWEEPYNWIHHLSLKFPKHVITVDWEEEQGYGEIYTITGGIKKIIEEWHLAKHEEVEVEGLEDHTVWKCIESGGRGYEPGMHKYVEGYFYVDHFDAAEDHAYESIEEIKQEFLNNDLELKRN